MLTFIRDNSQFVKTNARWIGGGFLLTFFSSFGQTFFIGLSGNDLRETFDLSGGAFGALYMVATLASAMTLPWLGRTLDLMPGWKVIRFSMPLLALACILIALAPNIAVLCLSLYMLRLFGQGMMTEIAHTETGRWFAANRGRAMALVSMGQPSGTAVFPAIVIFVAQASGDWRMTWFASAALILAVGLPAIMTMMRVERVPQSAEEAQAASERTARDWTRAEVLRDPVFYMILGGALAPAFIATVIFFHQGYLIELRGYDPVVFAIAFPVMSITTVIASFVCGFLVDRFGAINLLPYFLLPLTAASAAAALVTPVWGVFVFMFLLGISNGFGSTLLGSLWPEIYGVANLGGIRGIIVAAMVLSTAVGPGLTGVLIDFGIQLPTQMLWMTGWCVLATFLLINSARIVRRREARA